MTTVLDRRQDPRAEPAFGVAGARRRGRQPQARRATSTPAARRSIPSSRTAASAQSSGLVMAVTLGIYYALPWLRWNRGPDLPDQAVLLDMANNRFFFFFLEIWPQEFYYVTGLLVLAALLLFLADLGRRPRVVRLHLPADGVDRPDDHASSASGRATATRASGSTRSRGGRPRSSRRR